jgi:dihydrodipicolinate synthase/N-acetylneuraminate lyase
MQLDEAMLKLSDCEEAAKSRVHIIIGAFKNSSNADEYATAVQGQGYDGKIIAGPYSFSLVTASSHESLQAALNALGSVRETVVETAWIYLD